MFSKSPVLFILISFCLGLLYLGTVFLPERLSAEQANQAEQDAYAKLDVRAGVWDNGQAALWDLNLLDHFKIFGPPERARGHSPEQPIKFSHVTHVQKNKIDCQFCHWSVAKAPYAAIPEVETCMGCHMQVLGTKRDDATKAEIAKIGADYYSQGKSIPWVKVHVMPDHVKFNHKRHVKAGVTCQSCHGQIPEMEKVERVSSMKMGWCIGCHRAQGASIDCVVCHH